MAEAFADEVEQTVTIQEYIDGIEAEELEADLVLGGDDGKECTYANGYMKRQAVFSCLTCVPSGNAGVCTACGIYCHDGHEVVELWTKRNFRCDCGNSKFGEFSCKLSPNKEPENLDNAYNQNFKGSYCICVRPYPDPEALEQFEMIQCCICEDWFHENHIGLDSTEEIPGDEEGEHFYEDFICQECALSCSFLKLYYPSLLATEKQKNEPMLSGEEKVLEAGSSGCSNPENIDSVNHVSGSQMNISIMHSEAKEMSCNSATSNIKCILGLDISNGAVVSEKKPIFLSKKWRDLLCRCSTCTHFYSRNGLHFLMDKDDSLEEYEKLANQKRQQKLQQQEGAETDFLEKLNHVQKIEILRGISDFKNEFHSFMESYDATKPITSADVKALFENLAKKRQRLS